MATLDWDAAGLSPTNVVAVIFAWMTPLMPLFTVLLGVSVGLWIFGVVLRMLMRAAFGLTVGQRHGGGMAGYMGSPNLNGDLFGAVSWSAGLHARQMRQRQQIAPYLDALRQGAEYQRQGHSPMGWSSVFGGNRQEARRAASLLDRANAARDKAALVSGTKLLPAYGPSVPPPVVDDGSVKGGVPLGDLLPSLFEGSRKAKERQAARAALRASRRRTKRSGAA